MPRLLIVANVVEMFRDFLIPYAEYFRGIGWQVDAMANGVSRSSDCAAAFNRVLEVDWSRNPLCLSNFVYAPREVCREVDTTGYDLVHAHTPVAGFISRLALRYSRRTSSRAKRPKIIYTAHGFHFYPGGSAIKNYAFRSLEQIAGRWTDYLVVINRADEKAAKEYRLVPTDRLVYMPGIGVDLRHYSVDAVPPSESRRVRDELGIAPGQPVFLMIAEFAPGKRHRDTVHAFASLPNKSAHLVFAGEGPLMEQVKRLTSDLGLAERVHFLGYRQDVPALILASAATVLPSEREGLPRSIMESLSLGTPVIASDIRGCRDLLEGGAGLLVPVGDPMRLSQAMNWVLSNADKAAAMADIGRQSIASHDIGYILRRHEALYERALQTSGQAQSLYTTA